MFGRMKIATKIYGGYITVVLVVLFIGGMTIYGIRELNAAINFLNRTMFVGLSETMGVERYAYKSVMDVKTSIVSNAEDAKKNALANLDVIQQHLARLNDLSQRLQSPEMKAAAGDAEQAAADLLRKYQENLAMLAKRQTLQHENDMAVSQIGEALVTVYYNVSAKLQKSIDRPDGDGKQIRSLKAAMDLLTYALMYGLNAGLDWTKYSLNYNATNIRQAAANATKSAEFLTQCEALIPDSGLLADIARQKRNALEFAKRANDYYQYNDQALRSLNEMDKQGEAVIRHAVTAANTGNRIAIKMGDQYETLGSRLVGIAAVVIGLGVIFCFFAAVTITRSISRPIQGIVAGLNALGQGDFTKRLTITGQDEMGALAGRFNTVTETIQTVIGSIVDHSTTISRASAELSKLSRSMSTNADETLSKSNLVTKAAEAMNQKMNSAASAMEQVSNTTHAVAGAAEEITATIHRIAEDTETANSVSREAVESAAQSMTRVTTLGAAANQIGTVSESITEISEQTNLLALNATIEAARAGENGRGFAVVANEIKELAKQTAEATREIKTQIEGIQRSTKDAIGEISRMSGVVGDIDKNVSSITTAIDEQSITTKGIAENIAQASQAVQVVSMNVHESAAVSQSITTAIQAINQASRDISGSSAAVDEFAVELLGLAERLEALVGKFKV